MNHAIQTLVRKRVKAKSLGALQRAGQQGQQGQQGEKAQHRSNQKGGLAGRRFFGRTAGAFPWASAPVSEQASSGLAEISAEILAEMSAPGNGPDGVREMPVVHGRMRTPQGEAVMGGGRGGWGGALVLAWSAAGSIASSCGEGELLKRAGGRGMAGLGGLKQAGHVVRRFFAGPGRLFLGSWGGALAGIQFLLGIWLVAGAGLVPWRPGFWQVFLPAFLAVELAGWRLREGMRGSIPAGS